MNTKQTIKQKVILQSKINGSKPMKKPTHQKIKMNGDIPQPRFGHSFTMISKTKAVLFGGAVSIGGRYQITNETYLYEFDTCCWKKINFMGGFVPSERAAHAAAAVGDMQMVIYGGAASGTQGLLKDQLYLLDLRREPAWKIVEISPKNNTPGQRYGHTMVFSKPNLILFAGNSGNKVQNDVWLLNFQRGPLSWTKYQFENGRAPCPRVYHSAALCQQGKATGMMVVFGGRRQNNKKDHNSSQKDLNVCALNDIWGLVKHRNGVWDWNTPPRTDNYVPICRYQHLVCFVGSKLVIVGGRTNNPEDAVGPIQAYDTETAQWQKLSAVSRYRHAIALQKNCKLFVHGGFEPEYASQPLDTLICVDLSCLLTNPGQSQPQQQLQIQSQNQSQVQKQSYSSEYEESETEKKFPQSQQEKLQQTPQQISPLQQGTLSNLTSILNNTNNSRSSNTPNRRDLVPPPTTTVNKLIGGGLRQIGDSQRNVSNNSRIRNLMQKTKNERDLTPSRIINSAKNTRLSNQVIVAKGDKGGLQFERVPVHSLMEQSKKLNSQNYEDSTCSTYDQGLQELIDNILMILMPVNGTSKIINSNLFPLKKQKIYRLCYETSKILASQSSLIGVRTPIKIFGSLYGQHSELLRFFQTFDYPEQRQMETFDYIFLGNYVDKGFNSLQTICLLMALKLRYPQHVHLLRGKHEDINVNRICGLGQQCQLRLGQNINDPQSVFQVLNAMFDLMPLAAAIEDKFLCLNGSIGDIQSLVDIKNVVRPVKVKESQVVMELLWSDSTQNPTLEGYKSTKLNDQEMDAFLDDNGLDMIINCKDGLPNGLQQSKFELSIFTVPNFGNKGNKGCMLKINKNLQVAPQILRPQSTQGPTPAKAIQWVNQNEVKTPMQLNEGEFKFRKSMFQV